MTYAHESSPLTPAFAAMLEAWPDAAVLIEPLSMRVVAANSRARALRGRRAGDEPGDAAQWWSREDIARILDRLSAKGASSPAGEAESDELWLDVAVRGDNAEVSVRACASTLGPPASGALAELALVVMRSRDHLTQLTSGSALRQIVAQMPVGVLLAEPARPGKVLLNSACAKLCGVPMGDDSGLVESDRTWKVARPGGEELGDDELPTAYALQRGEPYGPEDLLLHPADGSAPKTASTLSVPVREATGKVIAAVTTVIDVTAHRAIEQGLREAQEFAEHDSRRKGAFYSSLSREIRSPLTSILGYVDLIGDPETPAKDRADWCALVRRSGDVLMGLIQDLVDLGQMEAGTFRLHCAQMQLGLVLAEVLSVNKTRAQRRGLDVIARYTTPIPRGLRWDAARLRQALTTVLSFCIDHADHGDVTLQVAMIGTDTGRKLAFDVSAWCRSVTAEDMDALLDPFTPTSPGSRAWSLAFPLASRLARLMGGTIEHKSDGQRLSVRITVAPSQEDCADMVSMHLTTAEELPSSSRPPPRLRGRVLLVEDSDDDRLLVTRLLERSGLKVESVASGLEALRAPLDSFDAVLMDVELPGMDGLEATRSLREAGVTIPVVALTAAALGGDRERCLAAGCTAYVSKPIDRPTLMRTLDDLISTTEDRRIMSSLPEELQVLEPLRSTREGDPSMRDALAQFAERAARYVEHITRSVESGDLGTAERAARSLGGTAGSYGFDPLRHAAERLAEACKAPGPRPPEIRVYVRAVNDVAQRVRAAYPLRSPTIPPPGSR